MTVSLDQTLDLALGKRVRPYRYRRGFPQITRLLPRLRSPSRDTRSSRSPAQPGSSACRSQRSVRRTVERAVALAARGTGVRHARSGSCNIQPAGNELFVAHLCLEVWARHMHRAAWKPRCPTGQALPGGTGLGYSAKCVIVGIDGHCGGRAVPPAVLRRGPDPGRAPPDR